MMEETQKERETMIFYKSFVDACRQLETKTAQISFLLGIFDYAFENKIPELTGQAKALFILVKPQIDANTARFNNGIKGGRPKTKPKPNDNLTETKSKPNNNVNNNNNNNNNVDVNVNYEQPSSSVDFLSIKECRMRYEEQAYQPIRDSVCIRNKIELGKLSLFLDTFDEWLSMKGELNKSFKDYTEHFARWILKQSQENKQAIYAKAVKTTVTRKINYQNHI